MKVVVARSVAEALAALASATESSRVLAGGTDLCVEFESGRTRPDLVVEVGRAAGLRFVRETDAGLEIGAGSTCSDLLRSAAVARGADLLALAARQVGAVQIQNRATLGGNLVTASPAADLVPALFALGARVRLASLAGRRELAVEEFVTGYRSTARRCDELVESVLVPPRPAGERRAFHKVGTRRAQSISKVVVALSVGPCGAGARIAAGSVAERTLRLATLEEELARGLTREGLNRAVARAVAAETRPRDDVRSTAGYRRAVLERILVRVLGPWLGPEGNAA